MKESTITRKNVLAFGMGGFGRQAFHIIQKETIL